MVGISCGKGMSLAKVDWTFEACYFNNSLRKENPHVPVP